MVADTVVYHPTLRKLTKFLDLTVGREKSLRLIQYFVRFLAFYVSQNGASIELVKLFKSLQANSAFIRKALRFLKPLNHLQDASKAFDNRLTDSIIRSTVVLKNLAYFGYLSLDSIAWFKILGVVSTKRFSKAPKFANWFWFAGLVAGLTNDLRKLSITDAKLQAVKSSEEDEDEKLVTKDKTKALELEKLKSTKRLLWDSLDFFIVLNNLQFLHYDEGLIGLAGTLTSIFGIQDVWNSITV